ncbi:MAG: hypothetical protein L0Y64_25470, partial [Myxococcaceae bacterium]|nr:hypothetical protein [Myxococcaceae bacterium]
MAARGPTLLRLPGARARPGGLFQLVSTKQQTYAERLRAILELDARTLLVKRVSYWALRGAPETIHCEDLYLAGEGRHESGLVLDAENHPRYFAALRTGQPIAATDAMEDPRTSEFAAGYL